MKQIRSFYEVFYDVYEEIIKHQLTDYKFLILNETTSFLRSIKPIELNNEVYST